MVLLDYSGGDNLHTEKLKVPTGIEVKISTHNFDE